MQPWIHASASYSFLKECGALQTSLLNTTIDWSKALSCQLIYTFIHQVEKDTTVEVFGSACMAAMTLLRPNSLRTPTTDCSYSEQHVLQQFLPDHNSHSYSLRPRRHNFILATKHDDRTFITRQLFNNMYWTLEHCRLAVRFSFYIFYVCFYPLTCTQLRSCLLYTSPSPRD